MKKNIDFIDGIVRILLAFTIAVLYFTQQISGSAATIAVMLGLILLSTAFTRVCPLYLPFGFSTRKKTA